VTRLESKWQAAFSIGKESKSMQTTVISTLFGVAILGAAALSANAQDEWRAPPEAAARKNPIATSPESVRLGHAAYKKACVSCHGDSGKGDGFAAKVLKRQPKNLAEVLGGQSDGEVFWKIRTGNPFMPSSASLISEEDTWHVVNFVRSLQGRSRQAREAPVRVKRRPWAAPALERAVGVRDGRTGEALTFAALLDVLATADAVFLGESHTDETTHRVELGVYEGLVSRRSGKVVLAMEMFERDVQGALDSYLAGESSEKEFLAAVRPWANYLTGYRPLVEFAKSRGLPIVASNFPRYLRRRLAMMGKEASLDRLEGAARAHAPKKLFANSPAYWRRVDNAIRGHIGMMGVDKGDDERLYSTQSLWDNAMGESCAIALDEHKGSVVLHVNGGFHSAYWDGTVRQLRLRKPEAKILTVSVAATSNPGVADPSGAPVADYVVYAEARAAGLHDGRYSVYVHREMKYRLHVPKAASAGHEVPLLIWLADDGFTAREGMALWRSRLGDECAIAVVEAPYRETQYDLVEGGRWFWPDSFTSDLVTAAIATEKTWAYLLRHFPLDPGRVCIAGEGTGATVVTAVSLLGSAMAAQAVAFGPRRYAKLKDLPLPLREFLGDDAPAEKSLRLFLAPADKEWWVGELEQYQAIGFESAMAPATADPWLRASEREAALREALGLKVSRPADGAARRHIVSGDNPRARLWARLLATKEAKKNGTLVAVLDTPPADGSSVALAVGVGPGQLAKDGGVPRCPGPFGGTTVLVLPAATAADVVKRWMDLQANDPLQKKSRFHRLRIATTGGDRDLQTVLRELADKGRKNVLIVPAVFCADGETMRALRRSVRGVEDRMTLRWRPGLGK